ncbi:MAG TPA: hypothetical protein VKB95_14560 [Chitinophagaceae bacterium]|nr:hypothetical protein [Chitinophagaceae bacterium]
MKLRETILKEHSKATCRRIVKWVGNDQKKFDELFKLFLNDEYRVVQRAAWPITYCVEDHPEFVKKHFAKVLKAIEKPAAHDSVKRNCIRFLQYIDIPVKFHGQVMDICFRFFSSPSEPVALKAFSITVLQKLAKLYPGIINEIKLIIEERWDYETPAFKARAKKLLKEFS